MRGAAYAWANARRLQRALADAGIGYLHLPELAPTTELRRLQYAADDRAGVGKRNRVRLDPEYERRYGEEVLDHADLDAVVRAMPHDGTTALLCVEADPAACHRSILAVRLAGRRDVRLLDDPSRATVPLPPNAAPWPAGHEPTAFERAVVQALGRTTAGDLLTYGELATEVAHPGAGQAVANVLRHAPDLPWWRVVPADGRLYRTHAAVQRPLLEAEGHTVDDLRRIAPAAMSFKERSPRSRGRGAAR